MYFLCSMYFCVVLCIVCFVSFSVFFVCMCVLNSCHRVATQLQLNISYHISYHIISYHIISYHIISYHIISYHIISYHIISLSRMDVDLPMRTFVKILWLFKINPLHLGVRLYPGSNLEWAGSPLNNRICALQKRHVGVEKLLSGLIALRRSLDTV